MYISCALAGFKCILNYYCITQFGYISAAYTTLLCYVLFTVAHYVYMIHCMRKLFPEDRLFNTERLLIISLCVLGCGILVMAFYEYWGIRYLILAVLVVGLIKRKEKILGVMKHSRSGQ